MAFSTSHLHKEPIRVVPEVAATTIPQALMESLTPSRGVTPTLEKFTLKNKVAVVTGYVSMFPATLWLLTFFAAAVPVASDTTLLKLSAM